MHGIVRISIHAGLVLGALALGAPAQDRLKPRTFAPDDWLGISIGKRHFPSDAAWRAALGRAYFEAPVIDHAIDLLRTEFVKTDASSDEGRSVIRAVKALLDRFVVTRGGAVLRDEAAHRFLTGSAAEREKAQLILARHESIPDAVRARVGSSPLLAHRAWAAWCNTDGPKRNAPSDPALFRRGANAPRLATDPLADVADTLRQRLLIPAAELAGYKEEYQKGYHATFVPAMARPAAHFPPERWVHVDFDGDGVNELFINGSIPDGWEGVEVTMILRWSASGKRWDLVNFRRWDTYERAFGDWRGNANLVIADFDGDGRPEVAEQTSIVAGWCWETIRYYDEANLANPPAITARGVRVATLPHDSRPVIVTRSAYNPTNGGKAAYLTTTLATRLCVTRRNGRTAETATVLVRGHGW